MTEFLRQIIYGKEKIKFDVLYVNRKTMEIAVHPDSKVLVKAPVGTEPTEIDRRILKRARWITKQLEYFHQFDPRTPTRKYIAGETHLYLGRQYRLKILVGQIKSVKLVRGFFYVVCIDTKEPEKVKSFLDDWYRLKAHHKYHEIFNRCWGAMGSPEGKQPRIQIRRMRSRWGSLSKSGTLTLNIDLIRAPRECIEYVITHELCHLEFHDHSKGFYRLLERVMPDWEKRKHRLELALV